MFGHPRNTAVTLMVILLIGGCGTSGVRYHNPQMDFSSIKSAAVLPFTNLTKEASAAERVRDVFTTTLLATGAMYVIPPGEVFRGLARTNPADPTRPSSEEAKRLAGVVGVDVVITGTVREYGEVRSGQTAANTISISMQMMEAQTGRVVWTGSVTKGGITVKDRLFGGGGEPMDEVTRKAVEDLLDKLFQKESE